MKKCWSETRNVKQVKTLGKINIVSKGNKNIHVNDCNMFYSWFKVIETAVQCTMSVRKNVQIKIKKTLKTLKT